MLFDQMSLMGSIFRFLGGILDDLPQLHVFIFIFTVMWLEVFRGALYET